LSLTSATRNQPPRQGRSGRTKDWLLYVAIAVLIAISVWIFAIHQARTGGSPNLPLKWLGFAGMTAIIFGYAIRACRRSWGKQKFWVLLGLFFAVHSGLGVFVLLRVATVPLVLYAVLTGIEYVVLASYLGFFLDSPE
jgi:Na+/melibiose symporter-like transporter